MGHGPELVRGLLLLHLNAIQKITVITAPSR